MVITMKQRILQDKKAGSVPILNIIVAFPPVSYLSRLCINSKTAFYFCMLNSSGVNSIEPKIIGGCGPLGNQSL